MTLKEAIEHCAEKLDDKNIRKECRQDHLQLYNWLVELENSREEIESLKYKLKQAKDLSEEVFMNSFKQMGKDNKRIVELEKSNRGILKFIILNGILDMLIIIFFIVKGVM